MNYKLGILLIVIVAAVAIFTSEEDRVGFIPAPQIGTPSLIFSYNPQYSDLKVERDYWTLTTTTDEYYVFSPKPNDSEDITP
jgi:hypothetical protein